MKNNEGKQCVGFKLVEIVQGAPKSTFRKYGFHQYMLSTNLLVREPDIILLFQLKDAIVSNSYKLDRQSKIIV